MPVLIINSPKVITVGIESLPSRRKKFNCWPILNSFFNSPCNPHILNTCWPHRWKIDSSMESRRQRDLRKRVENSAKVLIGNCPFNSFHLWPHDSFRQIWNRLGRLFFFFFFIDFVNAPANFKRFNETKYQVTVKAICAFVNYFGLGSLNFNCARFFLGKKFSITLDSEYECSNIAKCFISKFMFSKSAHQ